MIFRKFLCVATQECYKLKELLAYVQADKEKVSMAHAGIGAASHLCVRKAGVYAD